MHLTHTRQIRFGHHKGDIPPGEAAWVVDLDDPDPLWLAKPIINRGVPFNIGRIDYVLSVCHSLSQSPPSPLFTCPPAGRFAYSITGRYDLNLGTNGQGSYRAHSNEWLAALRYDPSIGNLYKSVDFGPLPVSFDDISNLYQRHVSLGMTEPLGSFAARNILPWTMLELRSFASLTTGLTSLKLAVGYAKDKTLLSFHDLPNLISTVQQHLPHLRILHVSISGIETAEEVCWDQLSQNPPDLGRIGKVRDFRIYTAKYAELFNTIRCLSSFVYDSTSFRVGPKVMDNGVDAPGGNIVNGVYKQEPGWSADEQHAVLRYLR